MPATLCFHTKALTPHNENNERLKKQISYIDRAVNSNILQTPTALAFMKFILIVVSCFILTRVSSVVVVVPFFFRFYFFD
jgi:integral membrane sensor domain MASE1